MKRRKDFDKTKYSKQMKVTDEDTRCLILLRLNETSRTSAKFVYRMVREISIIFSYR